jgi:hypothetical protein
VFRGLTYYANGLIYTSQDRERSDSEIVTCFVNSNVENGDFNYSTTSRKNRHSVAIIRYNDPLNFYQPAIEYVEDFNAIRKYGIKEIELTAFGCTSKGQANRLGRWVLTSDTLETESIAFTAGIEAARLRPGDVFKVFDYNRKLKRHGGRTLELSNVGTTGAYVVLDGLVDLEPNVEYGISFVTPSFEYNSSQVSGLNSNDYSGVRRSFIQNFSFSGWQSQASGTRTILNIFSSFDTGNYYVGGYPAWSLELTDRYLDYTGARYFTNLNSDYYRVINLKEAEINKYQIEGLQYNPQKYLEIESGLLFGRDIINAPKIPATPRNLTFNIFQNENDSTIDYAFLVDSYENINSFRVYVRTGSYPDNNVPSSDYLEAVLPSNTTYGSINVSQTGVYNFRVYSSNDVNGILSPSFASNSATVYNSSNDIQNATISSLRIINNETGIYSGSANNNYVSIITNNDSTPVFTWQLGAINILDTENLRFRATIRHANDSQSRIPNEPILYQETGIVNSTWNFDIDKNISSTNGPHRDYQVVIEAYSQDGRTSAGNQIGVEPDAGWNMYPNGYDILSISNPRQTGIQMQGNIPTYISGDVTETGNNLYRNYLFIDPNGGIAVQYTSGDFDSDLAGGYMYSSTGVFEKLYALTGYNQSNAGVPVYRNRFDFDPLNGYIYCPLAAYALRSGGAGFISLSFYDDVDKVLLERGVNIGTGLYLSNNSMVVNNTVVTSITLVPATVNFTGIIPDPGGDPAGLNLGGITIRQVSYPEGFPPTIDPTIEYATEYEWNAGNTISTITQGGVTTIIYAAPASSSSPWSVAI